MIKSTQLYSAISDILDICDFLCDEGPEEYSYKSDRFSSALYTLKTWQEEHPEFENSK